MFYIIDRFLPCRTLPCVRFLLKMPRFVELRIYNPATIQTQNTNGRGVVKVLAVNEDTAFVAASRRFEEAMASKGFTGFCQEKEASATTAHERTVWQFMPVIFERNARNQLLAHLGFEENAVMRWEDGGG